MNSVTLISPAGIESVPTQFSQLTPFMQELVETGRNRLLIDNVSDFERIVNMAVKESSPGLAVMAGLPFSGLGISAQPGATGSSHERGSGNPP